MGQFIFITLLASAIFLFYKSAKRIWDNIQLGLPFDRSDNKPERIKRMILIAFGQQKMFKKPIPAILHLFVYLGFLIVNIELIEIMLDGILGTHRLFEPFFGSLYPHLINFFEFFAVAVLISCVILFIRRNIIRVRRFQLADMKSWNKLDANLILIFEVVLMFFLLSMNATDTLIRQSQGSYQSFLFSDMFIPLFENFKPIQLHTAERFFWWAHIIGILFFANYVPYSKHLHIFLAFPNTYYSNLNPKGEMNNMESVTNEVKIMIGLQPAPTGGEQATEIARFGAKDIKDLTQKNLLDAYTCTECGRCTSSCPANLTGKTLSPRKIMIATRERLEEVAKNIKSHGPDHDDGKSLLNDYITNEEIFACTTCNACTEACPVNIEPVDIIMKLRRYKSMEESQGPSEWNMMYQNIETSFSPWKFPPTDRFNWKEELNK